MSSVGCTVYLGYTLNRPYNNLRDFTAINEILNEMNIPRGKEQQAYQHLMQIISNKVQGTSKKVIYWSDGEVKVKDTDLASYRTPYFTMLDKMGIKYALVDGTSHDWVLHPETNKLLYQPLDIFQNNSTIIGKADRQMIQQRRELFLDMLNSKKDIEGFEAGMSFIEMPGLKMSLAVSNADIDFRCKSADGSAIFAVDASALSNAGAVGVNLTAPLSTFDVSGSNGRNIHYETGASLTLGEHRFVVFNRGSAIAVTMPSIAEGRVYQCSNLGAGAVTFTRADSDTFYHMSGTSLTSIDINQGQMITLIGDESLNAWHVMRNDMS